MVVIYTGNTLQQSLTPEAEVAATISHVLESWQKRTGKTVEVDSTNGSVTPPLEFFENGKSLECSADITVKLFLPTGIKANQAASRIKAAMESYQRIHSARPIDHFILAFQDIQYHQETELDSKLSDQELFEIWKTLGTVHHSWLVREYGISELSGARLQALVDRIDKVNKKHSSVDDGPCSSSKVLLPSIDHINSSDCCNLPPSLVKLSKERAIKLLAHHDPLDLVPKKELASLGINGDWDWILRLTSIVKDRQIIAANEYLISIDSEL